MKLKLTFLIFAACALDVAFGNSILNLAWIPLAAGLLAGGLSMFSNSKAAKADKKAQDRSFASQQEADNWNAAMQLSNYGAPIPYREGVTDGFSGRQSSLFPIYGSNEEGALWGQTNNQWGQSQVPMERLREQWGKMGSSVDGARMSVAGLFNGQNMRQRLDNARPVFAARTNQAESSISATNLSLSRSLAEGDRLARAIGYSGDGLSRRLMGARMNIENAGNAASMRGGVNLMNAEDERAIRDSDIAAQLSNSSVPFSFGDSLMRWSSAPEQTASNLFATNFNNLYSPWKRNGQPNASVTPFKFEPIATNSMIAANGLANVAQGVGGYFANQQAQGREQDNWDRMYNLRLAEINRSRNPYGGANRNPYNPYGGATAEPNLYSGEKFTGWT